MCECVCGGWGGGGDVAHLVEHRTGTLPTQVRLHSAAGDFSPKVNFQCRLSYMCPYTPVCNRMHLHVCAVKDPFVHVGVRWIIGTLKHIACTEGWVARVCRSWLSPGRHPEFPMGEIHRDNTTVKSFLFCFSTLSGAEYASERSPRSTRTTGQTTVK